MLPRNEPRVGALVDPGDRVLEVGGRSDPLPIVTHRIGGRPPGRPVEWVDRDLSDRQPWPFDDRSFDFCLCVRTLETVRDPIRVCDEMRRVARRGYLEVTARVLESSRGQEPGVPVGFSGHRFLVEIHLATVVFTPKDGLLFGEECLSFPAGFAAQLPDEQRVRTLFWEDGFDCHEAPLPSRDVWLAYRRSILPDPVVQPVADAGLRQTLRRLSRRYPRLARPVKRALRAIA